MADLSTKRRPSGRLGAIIRDLGTLTDTVSLAVAVFPRRQVMYTICRNLRLPQLCRHFLSWCRGALIT